VFNQMQPASRVVYVMEHNGTSTEVHLVASRTPWCLLQLSEFQFDATAIPTPYTAPLACCRTNSWLTSQDNSSEGGQRVMENEGDNVMQGLLPNADWTKLQLAHARYQARNRCNI